MSTLGRQYGLLLIKQALESTESETYKHVPPSPEDQTRRIGDLFDQNEHRDPMTDAVVGGPEKVGRRQDFTAPATIDEHEENRIAEPKPVVAKDSLDPDFEEAWEEHDAFKQSPFAQIDSPAQPGPAV